MTNEYTVVFYKDDYDRIYSLDKIEYLTGKEIEFTLTTYDPNIPGRQSAVRVIDNELYRYGSITIDRKVISLSGPAGSFLEGQPYHFYSYKPFFNVAAHTAKKVKVRNFDVDGVLHQYEAIVSEVRSETHIVLSNVFNGAIVTTFTGIAHVSFDNSYSIFAQSEPYYAEDFYRVSYNCNVNRTSCGSKTPVSQGSFRFGPIDNFKYHLDNGVCEQPSMLVSGGSCFTEVGGLSVVWDAGMTGDYIFMFV